MTVSALSPVAATVSVDLVDPAPGSPLQTTGSSSHPTIEAKAHRQTAGRRSSERQETTMVVLAAGIGLALLVLGLLRAMGTNAFWQMHHTVTLRWNASTTPGVLRYNVYRSAKRVGPYDMINTDEVLGTSYVDEHVESCTHYYYVVRAVNINHKESIDSDIVEADVPWP